MVRSPARLRLAAVAMLAGSMVNVSAAAAKKVPPPIPEASAVAQYVESIPVAEGAVAPAVEEGDSASTLPAQTKNALTSELGAGEAKRLEMVATSTRYGAPAAERPPLPRQPATEALALGPDVSPAEAFASAAAGGDPRLIELYVLLGLITGSLAASLALRRGAVRRHTTLRR